MSNYLMPSKLVPPPARRELIARPQLLERLEAGLAGEEGFIRKLTLISSSAGSGKTTLAAEWLRHSKFDSAWLALDEADNDPRRFLLGLVAALKNADAQIGKSVEAAWLSPQPASASETIALLAKEIDESKRHVILALDDFHTIQTAAIHAQISFLLDYQPANLHLVIVTREDPAIPISRLRARGQIMEIRQDDLHFSEAECAQFLRDQLKLDLSREDIAALRRRTEGWIAGIQLAALAMRSLSDLHDFVQSFSGSNRFILDYLLDEVLEQQPATIQEFLLKTSILERLCGPLCDAVSGQSESASTLEGLDTANLFIVPLDQTRTWYRYHCLFAELLQFRLRSLEGVDPRSLHRTASDWFAGNDFPEEAVYHAQAAEDWPAAIRLINVHSSSLLKRGEVTTLLNWCQRVPDEASQDEAEFHLTYAWPLLLKGEYPSAAVLLERAESLAGEKQDLRAQLNVAQAYLAQARGEEAKLVEHSERALRLLPADDLASRCLVAVNLGLAYWHMGRLQAADQAFQEARQAGNQTGNDYARATADIFLARSQAVRGQLRAAEQALQEIKQSEGRSPIMSLVYLDLSTLYYEWNDLENANECLEQGLKIAHRSGHAEFEISAYLWMARVRHAQGKSGQAVQALQQARHMLTSGMVPARTTSRITALEVELGYENSPADQRAELPANDVCAHPFYRYLGLTQERRLMAAGRKAEARKNLVAMVPRARQSEWIYGLVTLYCLLARAADSTQAAAEPLRNALELAQPEGYLRTFVDAGTELIPALQLTAQQGIYPEYVGKILAAFGTEAARGMLQRETIKAKAKSPSGQLSEPLTERELEVLRLIAAGCSNRQIAEQLVVSLNTVKSHVHHLCGKLEAGSRTQAVARGHEAGLL
jgi:LuxR family maltose regulon positive regulatory protein